MKSWLVNRDPYNNGLVLNYIHVYSLSNWVCFIPYMQQIAKVNGSLLKSGGSQKPSKTAWWLNHPSETYERPVKLDLSPKFSG